MKDSNLIKNLKTEMAVFLGMSPEYNSQSFEIYFEHARAHCMHNHAEFSARFGHTMATLVSALEMTDKTPLKPSVIFGILPSGEIYAEVGGEKYSPKDSFYRHAAMQTSQLSEKVLELQSTVSILKSEIRSKDNDNRDGIDFIEKLMNLSKEYKDGTS